MAQGWRIDAGSVRGAEDLVGGRFIPVMEFSVTTDDGATNRFRIPTAQYNEPTVLATVQEWYDRHRAVISL
jgi:hypothetical protein